MTDSLGATPLEQRVAHGAHFLDQNLPGWRARVRPWLDLFDMGTMDYCVLALAGKGQAGPRGQRMHSAGSVCRAFPWMDGDGMGFYGTSEEYDALALLWKAEVLQPDPDPLPWPIWKPKPRPSLWTQIRSLLRFRRTHIA